MERSRIGIIIPAYNEARSIGSIVAGVQQYGIPIVVDDGSEDDTSVIAKDAGAYVERHASNKGYDQAINTGFRKAEKMCLEYAITIDADGQHNPDAIVKYIAELDNGADIVVGIRDQMQRLSECLFSFISKLLWKINDPLCGMKAYKMSVYREQGHFDSYQSIGTELAIYAARKGKIIRQIPIRTRERIDSPRFGSKYTANMKILRAIWKSITR